MGLFKNIIAKIGRAFLRSEQKALKMADLKQANKSVFKDADGTQVRTGRPNFEHKSGFYEGQAVDHFAKQMAGKTLKDVVDFVGDLKNFANPSEYERKIKTMNAQRAQASAGATALTVDGLFQFLAGGQNLTEQDRKAYSLIAKQTQAKARALAYIKANFVGICNMREIYGQEGEEQFKRLMDIVADYADADINGYTMPEFNPEVVNQEVYDSLDIYLKGATYAQRRCDDLLAERVDAEAERAKETLDASKEVEKNVDEYDSSIDEIAKRNATIQDIDEKLAQAETVSGRFAALKDEYDAQEDSHSLARNWFRGKRDIVKPAAERRDEFMGAFLAIARDFPLYVFEEQETEGSSKGFSFILDRETLSGDLANANNEDFQVIFDPSLSQYDALVDAIEVYNGDDTVDHSHDIFKTKIETGADNTRKSYLYTARQEKVMKDIFEIMKAHAQQVVNDAEYQAGDNILENFKYKTVKHAPAPEQLKEVGETIFGKNIDKGEKIDVEFEDLSIDQLKKLSLFIRSNESVKAFIRDNKEIRDYEIDCILLAALDPSVANKRDLKLGAVMNAMQRESIDYSIQGVDAEVETLRQAREENVSVRDENYQKADESLANLRKIKTDLEGHAREVESDSPSATESDKIRDQVTTSIDMIMAQETLPENADEIDDKTQKIGQIKIDRTEVVNGKKVKSVITYKDEITRISGEATDVSGKIETDQSNITNPNISNETRARYYERYFSTKDSEKVLDYMSDIETIIKRIKETEKSASADEHEAE